MGIPAALEGKLRLPLIGAPMFIVSRPALVIAQCTSGIVGSFPALNARPQQTLADWIVEIKDALGQYQDEHPSHPVAPFAVNQIVHKSNERLYADMETCVRHEVPIVITSLRPPEDVVNAVHEYGGLVFHDVISLRHAQKAMEQGVDGIIAVCAGAGGHVRSGKGEVEHAWEAPCSVAPSSTPYDNSVWSSRHIVAGQAHVTGTRKQKGGADPR